MNARFRQLLAPLVALAALLNSQGCARPAPAEQPEAAGDVVAAQKFVIRDSTGKERAVLGMLDDDRVYLTLFDAEGAQRAAVGVEHDGPSIKLFNAQGKLQAVLDLLGDNPRLTLFNDSGNVTHKAP